MEDQGQRRGDFGPRPRVTVNVAVSLDGRIAGAAGRRMLLSDPEDHERVHRMRSEHDAILVGVGTILLDDPLLRVRRDWVPGGRDPVRVVLDSRGRVPPDARVLKGDPPTWVYCEGETPGVAPGRGGEWIPVPRFKGGLDLHVVLQDLHKRGVRRLMVEGGSRVIASFMEASLVDELFVFVAPVIVGEDAPSLVRTQARGSGVLAGFRVSGCQSRETGVVLRLEPHGSS